MSDVDHSKMKLGLNELLHPLSLLALARYALPSLTWPTSRDHSAPASAYAMHLNDQLGICTIAALANMIATWIYLATGTIVVIDDSFLLAMYCQFGYVVGNDATDQGCDAQAVVDAAISEGLNGHKALAAVDVGDLVCAAIYFFGGCYLAVGLPIAAQSQAVWDIAPGTPLTGDNAVASWGRHLIILVGYDEDGAWAITWGQRKRVTHRWIAAYRLQAFALLSADMLRPDGKSAEGFDLDALKADLPQIGTAA